MPDIIVSALLALRLRYILITLVVYLDNPKATNDLLIKELDRGITRT